MSSRLIPPLLLVLVLTIAASAQTGGRPPTVGTTRIPTRPRVETPDWTLGSVFISGKVVLDEGSELTEPATIQTLCRGQRHTETYTDSHGNFSFEFGRRALTGGEAGLADAESSSTELAPRRSSQRDWRDCELQAVLPGFSSEQIPLISRISSLETADIGRIVLHRLGHVDGFTISKTTVFAPGSARKAFDKGREQEKKKKWDEAQQSFQKAVEIYSKYAVAWFELGRVQLQKNNPAGARHSFGE